MNYADALEHLFALGPELHASPVSSDSAAGSTSAAAPRRKFDLAHMRTLCLALGNPEAGVVAVLIAGTNGKGSTAATLASILSAAGYRVGLYTSPHLVRVNERIQIAQAVHPSEYGSASVPGAAGSLHLRPISDESFARLYSRVDDVCEQLLTEGRLPLRPSFFERLTAVAFLAFADTGGGRPVDMMVLEVGLGGRLDATNVVEPVISVITDIALDHQEYLGETIAEIAAEKCGILRRGGTLITLPQHPEANLAIGVAAMALGVEAISAAEYLPPAQRNLPGMQRPTPGSGEEAVGSGSGQLPRNCYRLRMEDAADPGELAVDSPLLGVHQQRNVALAIAAAVRLRNGSGYVLPNHSIEHGIRETEWAGRLEFILPNVLLDVAHNPAGAWTLRAALAALPEARPRTLIFSCLRDKDIVEMSRILFPLFDSSSGGDLLRQRDHIILAPIGNARAASVEELLAAAHQLGTPAHAASHLAAALAQARAKTPEGGLIVATGSVYLVGELRALILAGDA